MYCRISVTFSLYRRVSRFGDGGATPTNGFHIINPKVIKSSFYLYCTANHNNHDNSLGRVGSRGSSTVAGWEGFDVVFLRMSSGYDISIRCWAVQPESLVGQAGRLWYFDVILRRRHNKIITAKRRPLGWLGVSTQKKLSCPLQTIRPIVLFFTIFSQIIFETSVVWYVCCPEHSRRSLRCLVGLFEWYYKLHVSAMSYIRPWHRETVT